jgi:hypothetical protein
VEPPCGGTAELASSLSHLFLAAFDAESLLCSGVMFSARRFPPIFPPFLPISAMKDEIWARVGAAVIVIVSGSDATGVFSRVDSSTICRAH